MIKGESIGGAGITITMEACYTRLEVVKGGDKEG